METGLLDRCSRGICEGRHRGGGGRRRSPNQEATPELLSEGCSGHRGLSRQRRQLSICLEGLLPREAASRSAWLVLGADSDRALQYKALLE